MKTESIMGQKEMKKIIKNLLLTLCIFTTSVSANISSGNNEYEVDSPINKQLDSENEALNIIKSSSEGREVILENKAVEEKKKEDMPLEDKQLFERELILNWNIALKQQNKRGIEVVGKTTPDTMVKNAKYDPNKNTEDSKSIERKAVVKGYCFIPEEINVGKQKASLRAECQTNYGAVVVFGNLVNVNEFASLVLDAKYIEKNGYRFQVISSIVTNEEKTSYNLATYVNDRKIKGAVLTATSQGANEVRTYTNQYLQALEQSKRQQQLVYQNVSNGSLGYSMPTTLTNTRPPDPLHYLAIAGTNIITSAVKGLADSFKKDLPYLYQIVAKTKIWIDLEVKEEGDYVK